MVVSSTVALRAGERRIVERIFAHSPQPTAHSPQPTAHSPQPTVDLLTQYEIPYVHPLAVHFPLVLLLLGAAAAAVYAGLGTATWRWAALILIALGAASSVWAKETGETLEDTVDGEPVATAVLPRHEQGAEWTVRVSVLTVLALASLSVWARRQPDRFLPKEPIAGRVFVFMLAGVAAALVSWTAHLGGIMVWGVPT